MKGHQITRFGYGDVATPDPESLTIGFDIAQRLLSKEEVPGLNRVWKFEDVLLRIWDCVDDTDEMEKALHAIAQGDSDLAQARIRKLLTRAANELASDIEADVIAAISEHNRIEAGEYLAIQREQDREYHL